VGAETDQRLLLLLLLLLSSGGQLTATSACASVVSIMVRLNEL
jgi:hypothetical protein